MYRLFSVLLAEIFGVGYCPDVQKEFFRPWTSKFLAKIGEMVLKPEGLFGEMGIYSAHLQGRKSPQEVQC